MMGQALYNLHWTADEFWRSTPHEFYAACEASETPAAVEKDQFTASPEMQALIDAHTKKDKAQR